MSGFLPTGMATLLLADVEGSTRLWETQLEEMNAAVAAGTAGADRLCIGVHTGPRLMRGHRETGCAGASLCIGTTQPGTRGAGFSAN